MNQSMERRVPEYVTIYPDGVPIEIRLRNMSVGASVFVPCLNIPRATTLIRTTLANLGWSASVHPSTQDNILGVRFWRTM